MKPLCIPDPAAHKPTALLAVPTCPVSFLQAPTPHPRKPCLMFMLLCAPPIEDTPSLPDSKAELPTLVSLQPPMQQLEENPVASRLVPCHTPQRLQPPPLQ